jgi:TMEM175 potassium channel family protein
MNNSLIGINLIYLAFIAFLPFPTALLGNYFENPLAVTMYAVAVGIVSGMEVLEFRTAHRGGLMSKRMPEDVYRWGSMMSLSPLVFFALAIPLAFVNTTIAVCAWFLMIPWEQFAKRWKPPAAEEYL